MAIAARLGLRRNRDDRDAADDGAIDLLSSSFLGYSADGRGWDPAGQRLIDPVEGDVAHSAHLSGRAYAAVRRDGGQVIVVSLLGRHEARVTRFDQSGTVPVEIREFREVDDRLWLRGIKRTNGGDTVPADQQITDWFTWVRPDTSATWTRFDQQSPQGRAHELRLDWNPGAHWYDHPAFGDYDELVGEANLLGRLWPDVEPLPLLGR